MRNSRYLAKDAAGNTADWSLPFIVKLNIMILIMHQEITLMVNLIKLTNGNKLRTK